MENAANSTPANGNATEVAANTAPPAGSTSKARRQIRIQHFKLSLIWSEITLDRIRESVGTAIGGQGVVPMLTDKTSYRQLLEALLQTKKPAELKQRFGLPWEGHSGFWKSYLKDEKDAKAEVDLRSVKAARLAKELVPLRGKVPAKIEAPALSGQSRFSLEAYVYLHGISIIATANVVSKGPPGFSLEEVIQTALLIKGGDYKVTWSDGKSESLNLTSLIVTCMDRVRINYLGAGTAVARLAAFSDPFRIITIIKGEGVDPGQQVVQGNDIHAALQAMTQLVPEYKGSKVGELARARVQVPSSIKYAEGRLFFGDKRGRAIWFPNTFTFTDGKIRSLSCYHRNIVFASMQVDSLSNFVAAMLARIRNKKIPTTAEKEYAYRALVNLRQMYAGVNYTYRSRSLPLQMIDSGTVENINSLQKALTFNLKDLKPLAPAS